MLPLRVLIYGVIGAVLDRTLNTSPTLTVLGALIGYITWIVRVAIRLRSEGIFGIAIAGEYSWSLRRNSSKLYSAVTIFTVIFNFCVLLIVALVAERAGGSNFWQELLPGWKQFAFWMVLSTLGLLSIFYSACRRYVAGPRPTRKATEREISRKANDLFELAEEHRKRGEMREAEACYAQGLGHLRKSLSADHPIVVKFDRELAQLRQETNKDARTEET